MPQLPIRSEVNKVYYLAKNLKVSFGSTSSKVQRGSTKISLRHLYYIRQVLLRLSHSTIETLSSRNVCVVVVFSFKLVYTLNWNKHLHSSTSSKTREGESSQWGVFQMGAAGRVASKEREFGKKWGNQHAHEWQEECGPLWSCRSGACGVTTSPGDRCWKHEQARGKSFLCLAAEPTRVQEERHGANFLYLFWDLPLLHLNRKPGQTLAQLISLLIWGHPSSNF